MELSPLATFIFPFRTAAVCSVILYIFSVRFMAMFEHLQPAERRVYAHVSPGHRGAGTAWSGPAQHDSRSAAPFPQRTWQCQEQQRRQLGGQSYRDFTGIRRLYWRR